MFLRHLYWDLYCLISSLTIQTMGLSSLKGIEGLKTTKSLPSKEIFLLLLLLFMPFSLFFSFLLLSLQVFFSIVSENGPSLFPPTHSIQIKLVSVGTNPNLPIFLTEVLAVLKELLPLFQES